MWIQRWTGLWNMECTQTSKTRRNISLTSSQNLKYLDGWITGYTQITSHAHVGKFNAASFCVQVPVWNKCVQIIYTFLNLYLWIISDIFANLLRHIFLHIESILFHVCKSVRNGRFIARSAAPNLTGEISAQCSDFGL